VEINVEHEKLLAWKYPEEEAVALPFRASLLRNIPALDA
jgi:hypothetical protein